MTTNPAPQPPFPGEHRSPVRAGTGRWKAGAGPAVLPLRQPDADGTPKVWLRGISLSYKSNHGSRLLALDDIDLKVSPGEFVCVVGKQLVALQEQQNRQQEQRNRDQEQRNQQMERDNLTLQLRVEEGRAARLRIEERFSPRKITHDQAKSLQEHLSQFLRRSKTIRFFDARREGKLNPKVGGF